MRRNIMHKHITKAEGMVDEAQDKDLGSKMFLLPLPNYGHITSPSLLLPFTSLFLLVPEYECSFQSRLMLDSDAVENVLDSGIEE